MILIYLTCDRMFYSSKKKWNHKKISNVFQNALLVLPSPSYLMRL